MNNFHLENLGFSYIEVDGLDVTSQMIKLGLKFGGNFDVIFLHGAPYAGFNIVDVETLFSSLNSPIICVISSKPRPQIVERALKKHFSDWKFRVSLLRKFKPAVTVRINNFQVHISNYGIELQDSIRILEKTTVFGKFPEPLRVAKLIARGLPPKL